MAQIEIKGKFEGYLWESDKQVPEVCEGNKIDVYTFDDETNPFIIEGQLYDSETGQSVSIKYVDGEYKIKKYYIDNTDSGHLSFSAVVKGEKGDEKVKNIPCEVKELHYKGNSQLKGYNLHFYELWEEKPDPLCCKMKVLEATKVIFAGFE